MSEEDIRVEPSEVQTTAARVSGSNLVCSFKSAQSVLYEGDTVVNTSATVGTSLENKNENQIAIILGYFEGEEYVKEQLYSIFKQTHKNFHLFLCDDCSEVPFSFKGLNLKGEQLSKLSVGRRIKNIGYAANFLNALEGVGRSFRYFAFSDQDDIWYESKLQKAVAELAQIPNDVPALYCARTESVDSTCKQTLSYSPRFRKPPSFANSLVQNIAGGNTIVLNRAARDLIAASSLDVTVVSHDWWCYQIVSGAGGIIIYDTEPCLKYRQHGNNLIGANVSWAARFLRIRGLTQGRFRAWNDINSKALLNCKHLLTEETIRTLESFIEARQSHFFKRLILFKRSGIYRQTLLGNLGLLLGVIMNRV
jgi:glycosyltransferase involved in cell wall biosynthesis